jgi:peptidoglycan L-alanyl-D-glutamate endopeptidase CwlK
MGKGTHFGRQSRAELDTCHPYLVLWAERLLAHPELPYDLRVWEGHRDEKTQNHYNATGVSKVRWPNSYHNRKPSQGIDILPIVRGVPAWDRKAMEAIALIALNVWADLVNEGTVHGEMTWGGDWDRDGDSSDERFFDGAHFQVKL